MFNQTPNRRRLVYLERIVNIAMKGIKPYDVGSGSAKSETVELKHVKGFHGQRHVAIWSKNWIAFRYAALLALSSFLLITDIHCCRLLFLYDPENISYGLFLMGFGNLIAFAVLAAQARELIDDSKTANDVPWWCYGCTNSRCN